MGDKGALVLRKDSEAKEEISNSSKGVISATAIPCGSTCVENPKLRMGTRAQFSRIRIMVLGRAIWRDKTTSVSGDTTYSPSGTGGQGVRRTLVAACGDSLANSAEHKRGEAQVVASASAGSGRSSCTTPAEQSIWAECFERKSRPRIRSCGQCSRTINKTTL